MTDCFCNILANHFVSCLIVIIDRCDKILNEKALTKVKMGVNMKRYFIIILILAGMNFVAFGQNKKNIKQSGEVFHKPEIREQQSKENKLQKENDFGAKWFLFAGPLFGIMLGGLITYFIERSKNKLDEQRKTQDWFKEEVINNFMECICYYEKLRIIVLSGKIKNNNLEEPMSAIIKIIYFTGIRHNINNFTIILGGYLRDLIKASDLIEAAAEEEKEEYTQKYLELQSAIANRLEEYCTHLYKLYNCLLSQTIKKKADVAKLKDKSCKQEIEEFNKFITESLPLG